MKKKIDNGKIAMLTGVAVQDDETFKLEGGFIPERDQYYFQMQQGDNIFLLVSKTCWYVYGYLKKWGNFLKSAINGGCR